MSKVEQFQFFVPTRILFGKGQVKNLHTIPMPGKKALVVITSGRSTREYGYLDLVLDELKQSGVDVVVFDQVASNPLVRNIEEGAFMAKKCGCDFIVGLGGGSPIDASKAIAVMATNEGELWDYMNIGTGKKMVLSKAPLPIIAITTTAGTGSEADAAFVVTKEETNEKLGMYHPGVFPKTAIVDPELMTTVPPKFTAFQGFDAIFHSTEGYISNKATYISDMVAITAIEHVARNLKEAVLNGNNLEAREKVAFGATLSGIQLAVGSLTSAHAMEHALSAYHQKLPHGAGLILISVAYYKRFVQVPELKDRFIRMAEAMGYPNRKEPMDFIRALEQLIVDCDLENLTMKEYGITRDEFPKFLKNARETGEAKFANDYVMLSDDECIEIFNESYR